MGSSSGLQNRGGGLWQREKGSARATLGAASGFWLVACVCALCWCLRSRITMQGSEDDPGYLLRRLQNRDMEMCVLLQRVVLLEMPSKSHPVNDAPIDHAVDPSKTAEVCRSTPEAGGELSARGVKEVGIREVLKERLTRVCRSQQKASHNSLL